MCLEFFIETYLSKLFSVMVPIISSRMAMAGKNENKMLNLAIIAKGFTHACDCQCSLTPVHT